MARLLLLALIAYTVLDFANPLLPGAVTFDDDEDVVLTAAPTLHRDVELASAIAAPPRWLGTREAYRIEARLRSAPDLRPVKALPPPLRPHHRHAQPPPDASDDH